MMWLIEFMRFYETGKARKSSRKISGPTYEEAVDRFLDKEKERRPDTRIEIARTYTYDPKRNIAY